MESFESVLAEALRLTREIQLPEHLESIAFAKAIDILSAQGMARAKTPTRSPEKTGDTLDGLERIAAKLAIEISIVSDVFHYENEILYLSVGPAKLKAEKSAATRDLALLVAGSRQLAGIEEWTSSSAIREVCQDYGRFDSANFAATLTEMVDVFGFSGKGKSRAVKINRTGIEEFKRLIIGLAGLREG